MVRLEKGVEVIFNDGESRMIKNETSIEEIIKDICYIQKIICTSNQKLIWASIGGKRLKEDDIVWEKASLNKIRSFQEKESNKDVVEDESKYILVEPYFINEIEVDELIDLSEKERELRVKQCV